MNCLSVIVPCYNVERTLAETLESVRKQEFTDWEIVAVDDGSIDGTGLVLNKLAALDDRIRLIHQSNAGLSAARNTGIHNARGEFITFLDADDLVYCNAYARQIAWLREQKKHEDATHTGYYLINEHGEKLLPDPISAEQTLTFENFIDGCFPPHCVIFRKEALNDDLLFDESLTTSEDFDFWQRLARRGVKFHFIKSDGVGYRLTGKGMMYSGLRRHFDVQRAITERALGPATDQKCAPLYQDGIGWIDARKILARRAADYAIRMALAGREQDIDAIREHITPETIPFLATDDMARICTRAVLIHTGQPLDQWPKIYPEHQNILTATLLNIGISRPTVNSIMEKLLDAPALYEPPACLNSLQVKMLKTRWELFGCRYKTVALFGVSTHTRWFLEMLGNWLEQFPEFKKPQIAAVLDENAGAGGMLKGIPVLHPRDADSRAWDAVILSSDSLSTRQAMLVQAEQYFGNTIPIIDFYDQAFFAPVQKQRAFTSNAAAAGSSASIHSNEPITKYMALHKTRKLHLGCGEKILTGWLNTDIYAGRPDIVFMNAARDFPLPENSFDFIFSEHMIEHFTYAQGCALIHECFRVLKPGGVLRIATPDFNFLRALTQARLTKTQNFYLRWAAEQFIQDAPRPNPIHVINNFMRDWGHSFIYDYDTLAESLTGAGFTDVKRQEINHSQWKELVDLEIAQRIPKEYYRLETMVVETVKP